MPILFSSRPIRSWRVAWIKAYSDVLLVPNVAKRIFSSTVGPPICTSRRIHINLPSRKNK